MYVAGVNAKSGTPLMPTTNPRKVRRLLKEKRAEIFSYEPFAIRLLYEISTKPSDERVELCVDSGQKHVGLSVKSAKREFLSEERTMLEDEKERHEQQKKYRSARRSKLRHRKEKEQAKPEGWFAPSIRHVEENHLFLIEKLAKIFPVTNVIVEVASFDVQALTAIQKGEPLPQGTDYQQGPTYGFDTLREAMFYRDGYKCVVCGKTPFKDNAILRMHHLGFWKGDHSDRIDNLATVCTKCHVPKNHEKGGALWGLEPKTSSMAGAAFMNAVRWKVVSDVKELEPVKERGIAVSVTYGAVTKRTRLDLGMEKSHADDAYCMGKLRPVLRAETTCWKKVRRNNRRIESFYDAKYEDARVKVDSKEDPKIKSGSELSCGRTNRSEPRNSDKNLRVFRGRKVSKGRRAIRKKKYKFGNGDVVVYDGKRSVVIGVHSNGTRVMLESEETVKKKDVKPATVKNRKTGEEKPVPMTAGNKCVVVTKRGNEKKRLILREVGDFLVLKTEKSVNIKDVRLVKYAGGWIRRPAQA